MTRKTDYRSVRLGELAAAAGVPANGPQSPDLAELHSMTLGELEARFGSVQGFQRFLELELQVANLRAEQQRILRRARSAI